MADVIAQLENGLELWKANVDEVREQDKNARYMDEAMFQRLESTIQRDGRLENLPFCAQTEKGIEVVSGHHRIRAARAADVRDVFVLVDVSGLSRSQITAKQLAHNSIQGYDNPQLLRELYESIEDVDARLEAFIDPNALDLDYENLAAPNVNLTFDHRLVMLTFMPTEHEAFLRAWQTIEGALPADVHEVWVAERERLEQFQHMLGVASRAYEVKAFGTILGAIADLVLRELGAEREDEEETERIHLSEIVKGAYIPREEAGTIEKALECMKKDGIYEGDRWQGLAHLASEYLAGRV